ncbi:MAG: MFS transporter [bacterium]|nr:MFS transporter [bacterium]
MKNPQRVLMLTILSLCGLMYFVANFQRIAIPGAVFDILEQELSVSAPFITAFGAIFMYVYALGQLITGVMVNRYGGIRVITCGGILFTIGCILFPTTRNLYLMYLSRALLGFGSSMFYLSMVKELKNLYSDKNYGIALSVMLFVGYFGGIFANAPFVAMMKYMNWREILITISLVILLTLVILFILLKKTELPKINTNVTLKWESFVRVLHKKHNRNLFGFACCNFGISYVIQAIIGKKFLEDYCFLTASKAAFILSIMAIVAAIFNIINASICKLCDNHRVLFLKGASVVTFLSLLSIFLLILFDKHTVFIGLIFCVIAGNASISALLIPVIQQSNREEVSVTAVSIMNFFFFMMVGILGTLTGFILNCYSPERINGVLVYGKNSYLLLFGVFLALSIYEMYKAKKLSNHY